METKRKALGKGLEQLFSNEVINFENFEKDIVTNTPKNDITEIKISDIRSNPYQPRKTFNESSLKELADSIKEYGIIEPIIVKKSVKGYELIAGERRTKAAKLAGLETIPAVIKDFNDQEMMEIAKIGEIIAEIRLDKAITQDELAKKFGKSRSYVTNMLGLLNLPENVKELVKKHEISMGHARALSKISDDAKVSELASRIVSEDLSVRDLEKTIQEGSLPKYREQDRMKETKSIRNTIYEKIMREKVGTKVKIKTKKIEIPYDSEKDLERILEILGIRIEGV